MLPPTMNRASAHRALYHIPTVRKLGASSELGGSFSVVVIRRDLHQPPSTIKSRHRFWLRHNPKPGTSIPSFPSNFVRHRSIWGRSWDCHSAGIKHRKGCIWLRADADTTSIPFDKECPACQDNERRPLVLSPGEVMWQKRVEHMKQWVDKDPYTELFGKGNNGLAGVWQGWRKLQARWPFMQEMDRLRQSRDYSWGKESNTLENSGNSKATEPEKDSHQATTINAGTSYSSLHNDVSEEIKEWQFDPISMRRVPKSVPTNDQIPSLSAITTDITPELYNSAKSKHEPGRLPRRHIAKKDFEAPYRTLRASNPDKTDSKGSMEILKAAAKPGTFPEQRKGDSSGGINTVETSRSSNVVLESDRRLEANANIRTKESFERYWTNLRNGSQTHTTESFEDKAKRIKESAHEATFRGDVGANEKIADRQAYGYLYRRDRPYKHMTAHEFGNHKAALLKSWIQKHQSEPEESAADKMLNNEIASHKAAMNAYENRKMEPTSLVTDASIQAIKQKFDASALRMSSSSGGSQSQKEHEQDRILIRDLAAVYEKEYGTIDENHRQGRGSLDGCLSEYERNLDNGGYNFRSGQDNFEQVAKTITANPTFSLLSNAAEAYASQAANAPPTTDAPTPRVTSSAPTISTAPTTRTASISPTSSNTPTAEATGYEDYDREFGTSTYTFKSGQDNLEQELKTKSANPYAEAVAKASGTTITKPSPVSQATGYEEHDRKLGANPYIFVTGQDDLEQELKTKSANPYAAAVAIATTQISEPASLLTKLEEKYKLNSEVEPSESEPEVLTVAKDSSSPPVLVTEADSSVVQPVQPSTDPQLYQILAYDTSDHSVHTAAASSTFSPPTGETILLLSDALTRLHAPAKFLPHLTKLQADGYDVVSANRNLLVLKRVRTVENTSTNTADRSKTLSREDLDEILSETSTNTESDPGSSSAGVNTTVNPIDGTSSYSYGYGYPPMPEIGNFASPTGFVNHDTFAPTPNQEVYTYPTSKSSSPSSHNTTRVRKNEPVFSGAQKPWNDGNPSTSKNTPNEDNPGDGPKKHDRTRTILGTAVTVLAFCYITGLLVEELRPWPTGAAAEAEDQRSHGVGSAGMGLTDRAMWAATPGTAARKEKEGKSILGVGQGGATVAAGAAAAAGETDEEEVNAAQWVGAALCVTSLVAVVLGLVSKS